MRPELRWATVTGSRAGELPVRTRFGHAQARALGQDDGHAWSPQRATHIPRRALLSAVTGELGPKVPGFFGRGRIELHLIEPSADDEEVHLRRLVPIDDLLHLAREEGAQCLRCSGRDSLFSYEGFEGL